MGSTIFAGSPLENMLWLLLSACRCHPYAHCLGGTVTKSACVSSPEMQVRRSDNDARWCHDVHLLFLLLHQDGLADMRHHHVPQSRFAAKCICCSNKVIPPYSIFTVGERHHFDKHAHLKHSDACGWPCVSGTRSFTPWSSSWQSCGWQESGLSNCWQWKLCTRL